MSAAEAVDADVGELLEPIRVVCEREAHHFDATYVHETCPHCGAAWTHTAKDYFAAVAVLEAFEREEVKLDAGMPTVAELARRYSVDDLHAMKIDAARPRMVLRECGAHDDAERLETWSDCAAAAAEVAVLKVARHEAMPDEVRSPLERLEAGALDTAAIKALPPPDYLIDGLLPLDSLVMAYGKSGCGKSFAMIGMAVSVALGVPWCGFDAVQGPVVYVAAEGQRGIGKRIAAIEEHLGVDLSTAPITWLPMPVNIFQPEWAGALAEFCEERKPVLVLLDTLARNSLGAEENSNTDAGRIVEHSDAIRRRTGAAVVWVHHTGHAGGHARGATAYTGAAEAELEFSSDGPVVTMRVTKQKDGAEIEPTKLRRIEVGPSCVLVPGGDMDVSAGITPGVLRTRDALAAIETNDGAGVSSTAWRVEAEVPERTFYNHRKLLMSAGLVENIGTSRRPSYRTVGEPS